jgi:threonine/homoserine/homoserine lactone efflux protein
VISGAHLLAFVAASVVLVVIPGPSVLFVVSRTLVMGRRGGMTTVVGNSLGGLVQVVLVAVGVGTLVERSVVAFTALKLIGAAYLVFLGVQAIRHRRALPGAFTAAARPKSTGRVLREGFLVGATNPKGTVFFVAVLPQFIDRTEGAVPLQLLVLGLIFLVVGLVNDTAFAFSAGAARSWFERSPRRLERIGGFGGVTMIGVGVALAFTGRPD